MKEASTWHDKLVYAKSTECLNPYKHCHESWIFMLVISGLPLFKATSHLIVTLSFQYCGLSLPYSTLVWLRYANYTIPRNDSLIFWVTALEPSVVYLISNLSSNYLWEGVDRVQVEGFSSRSSNYGMFIARTIVGSLECGDGYTGGFEKRRSTLYTIPRLCRRGHAYS